MLKSQSSLFRIASLLGLCLLMVVMAVEAFAQQGPGATSVAAGVSGSFAFPYFGPDQSGVKLIRGSYIAQSYLFGGFSGATGSSAISVLGLLAALGGAIFLVFNRSLWRADILISWFILLTVLLFNPTNSRLLLMPVPQDAGALATFAFGREQQKALGGQTAYVPAQYYGFSPQVAAIDVASRMQLVVSDMFRSSGWTDLIGLMMAAQKIQGGAQLVADKPWLDRLRVHDGRCGNDLTTLEPKNTQNYGSNNVLVGNGGPENLGSVWNKIKNHYLNPTYKKSPPPLILLPDDDKIPTNFSEADRTAYVLGIDALFRAVTKERTPVCLQANGITCAPGSISVATALRHPTMNKFFEAPLFGTGALAAPGFFMMRLADYDTALAQAGSSGSTGSVSALQMRQCYFGIAERRDNELIQSFCPNFRSTLNTNNPRNPASHAFTLAAVNTVLGGKKDEFSKSLGFEAQYAHNTLKDARWDAFQSVFNTISSMPVAHVESFKNKTQNQANGAVSSVQMTGAAQSGYNCKVNGENLVKEGLNFLQSQVRNRFQPLEDLLLGKGSGGLKTKKALKIDDLVTSASSLMANEKELAGTLQKLYNGAIADEVKRDPNVTDETLRLRLLADTLNIIRGNTTKVTASMPNTVEANAVKDAQNVQVSGGEIYGFSPLTSIGGFVANYLGSFLVGVSAYFTGALAQAFISFIVIIVQLCLLALIVVTPFLFLIGVMIPGNAPGILILSVISVFILQFVPVTLIMLNYLGGFVYSMVGATSDNANLMQSMIIIAISGMYMAVVGLTLSMMPKFSDPLGIMGKLGGLDSAAKDAADAGMKAAIAGASAAALPFVGAATAALGNAYNNWAKGVMGAAGDALGLGEKAGEKGLQEEETKKNADGSNFDLQGALAGGYGETLEERQAREAQVAAEEAELDRMRWEDDDGGGAIGGDGDKDGGPRNISDLQMKPESRTPEAVEAAFAKVAQDTQNQSSKATDVRLTGSTADAEVNIAARQKGLNEKQPQVMAATNAAPAGAAAPQVSQGADDRNKAADTMKQAADAQAAAQKAQQQGAAPGTVIEAEGKRYMVNADGTVSPTAIDPRARNAGGSATDIPQQTVLAKEQELIDSLSKLANALNSKTTNLTEKDSMIGATMAAKQTAANTTDEQLRAQFEARKGADAPVNTWQAARSGFIGGIGAIFKGAGDIPVIGKILRETSNEWYEGTARARAWNAAGGYSKWKQKLADAERGKYVKQQLGAMQGGMEYQEMMRVGGYQETHLQAQQAAAAGAAQIQSSYIARQTVAMKDADFQGKLVLNATDLKGIGMNEAMNKIVSVRAEAAMMQGPGFDIKVAAKDGAGNLKLNADGTVEFKTQQVKYSASIFQDWATNAAMSGLIKNMENNQVQQMKVIEKQYFRDGKFNEARNTSGSMRAQAQFMRLDPGDSYLEVGDTSIREGKIGFQGPMGQAYVIREAMKREVSNIDDNIASNLTDYIKEYTQKEGKAFIDLATSAGAAEIAAHRRAILGKFAKRELAKSDPMKLPLESLYTQALETSKANFKSRSLQAGFTDSAEAAGNYEKIVAMFGTAIETKSPNLHPSASRRLIRQGGKTGASLDLGKVHTQLADFVHGISTDLKKGEDWTASVTRQIQMMFTTETNPDAMRADAKTVDDQTVMTGSLHQDTFAKVKKIIESNLTETERPSASATIDKKTQHKVGDQVVLKVGLIDDKNGTVRENDFSVLNLIRPKPATP